MIDPQALARFAAYGVSALDPQDLPQILDALKNQRSVLWSERPPVGPKARPFLRALSRIDALISEVEYAITPTLESTEELRIDTCRAAYDAYVVAFGCDPS